MSARPADEVNGARTVGRLGSAALLLSAAFVLSRVLGVLRNAAIADIFGSSRTIDAYFAAFRVPDTIFTLVSGAALATAFVPTFAGLLETRKEREGWQMASTVLNSVFLALGVLALIAFVFAPQIMDVLVGGYTPKERSLTVELSRIMLLQPIFLGVAAIVSAILQTYSRFFLTAIAPLLYNLAIIFGALFFGRTHGVQALAWSVVLGAVAFLVVQLPGFPPTSSFRLSIDWKSPAAREVLHLLAPRLVGVAAFQAMILITLFLAAGLPAGNVAAFNYAWPLIAFPIGAFGTAAATAMFPTLSRLSAIENVDAVRDMVNRSLRLVIFLSLPSAVGLIVLRRPIVNLLYNHGRWTGHATEQTAFALLFFALAIAPLAAIEVFPRVFYARKNTITPVRIAIVAVALDAGLGALFVHTLPRSSGVGWLALATAIASTIQAVWLARALERSLGGIDRSSLLETMRNAGLASLVMGLLLYVVLYPLIHIFSERGWGDVLTVSVEIGLGLAAFAFVAYLLQIPELWQVRRLLARIM